MKINLLEILDIRGLDIKVNESKEIELLVEEKDLEYVLNKLEIKIKDFKLEKLYNNSKNLYDIDSILKDLDDLI